MNKYYVKGKIICENSRKLIIAYQIGSRVLITRRGEEDEKEWQIRWQGAGKREQGSQVVEIIEGIVYGDDERVDEKDGQIRRGEGRKKIQINGI